MTLLKGTQSHLPVLPGGVIMNLEGENLDRSALMLRPEYRSAEDAVVQFRQRHSAEALPFTRRYYLEPQMRGGRATGSYLIRYVWNTSRKRTDQTVGIIHGEDLVSAKILIGNQVANHYMTAIRWVLCEDRAGEEVIEAGRFDVWSLLRGVDDSALALAASKNVSPDFDRWDFDRFFFERDCPGCGVKVSVNMYAFNIDSARCVKCGIRPHLSKLMRSKLHMALPSVTGEGERFRGSDQLLLGSVGYLGYLGASVSDLHQEDLPEGWTPHKILVAMLGQSRLLVEESDGGTSIVPSVLGKLEADGSADLASRAASVLTGTIRTGGPFNRTHEAIAHLLETLLEHH